MTSMTAVERREAIRALLARAEGPVSATVLAGRFSVSRQIIVGDVALLRAAGENVSATPRGYVMTGAEEGGVTCKVACVHGPEGMERELQAIVDAGGEAVDVVVEHPVYGQLTGELHVCSRYDVEEFLRRVEENGAKPLSNLTGGIHLHTISARDESVLERVRAALEREGLLYSSLIFP